MAIEEDRIHDELINFLSYPTSWVLNLTRHGRDEHNGTPFADDERSSVLVAKGLPLDATFQRRLHWLMTKLHECPLASIRTLWKIQSDQSVNIAWLPADTVRGDDVCAFAGAPWPFVVRSSHADSYRLIGDCHVLWHFSDRSFRRCA